MIDIVIKQLICEAFKEQFGIGVDEDKVVLTSTKKEFKGDYTFVVFPFMQLCGLKNPVELANKIGDGCKNSLGGELQCDKGLFEF